MYNFLHYFSIGPSVIRTKNAENRANKLNQAKLTDDSIDLVNPTDSLEDLEADRLKRQMWRKERMDSLDVVSENGDQILRLIKNSTPIPT